MSSSLAFVSTGDVSALAASLEQVGREYYRQARQQLKADAASGRLEPERLAAASRGRLAGAAPAVLGQRRRRALRPLRTGRRPPALPGEARRRTAGSTRATWTASAWGRSRARSPRRARGPAISGSATSPAGSRSRSSSRARCVWLIVARASSSTCRSGSAGRSSSSRPGLGQLAAGRFDTRVEAERAGRDRRRHRRVQPDGGPAAAEPRPPRLPDAGGELAAAGAQDGARAEELADADPPDGRGDRGAPVVGRPRVLRARGGDRRGRGDEPRAARPRVLGVRRRARGAPVARSISTRSCASAWTCCAPRIPA